MLRGEKCTKLPSLCDEMKIMFKYQQRKERNQTMTELKEELVVKLG